jgi:Tol biopolymer transport system component
VGLGWSPDGTHVAFSSAYGTIVSEPDGSNARVVSVNPSLGLAWSPDSTMIIHGFGHQYAPTGFLLMPSEIVDLAGHARQVTTAGIDFDWSPGSTILSDDGSGGAVIINPSDGSEKRVFYNRAGPRWSPDATRFAAVTATDTVTSLGLYHLDGTGDREVLTYNKSSGKLILGNGSWSPDGTHILIIQGDTSNSATSLVSVNVATGSTQTVWSGSTGGTWSPA